METTTTTGTGALTLAGAVTGYQRFNAIPSIASPSDTVYCATFGVDGSGVPTGEWESGLYTYSAANTLTRTTVQESSNANAAVSFSAGTKYVIASPTASLIATLVSQSQLSAKPGGRLTLVTATPILTSDQTAKTAIYYTPYQTDIIPIYNVANWTTNSFTELTLTLDTTNHVSGSLYDVFVWNNSGTISIGTGPAWSSSTSRGTGAGTTELQLINGIWTNKVSITLKNGAGAGTAGVTANTATYVGTFYATANGQTGMAFAPSGASGGNNNYLALYNAYNRIRTTARCKDSTASWVYATGTWRASDNSTSNRVNFVDGLQQSFVDASFQQLISGTSSGFNIGISLDSTSATPDNQGGAWTTAIAIAKGTFMPQIGFHYLQAQEWAGASSTFWGGGYYSLSLSMDM